jgi:hypothetical protein
MSVTKNVAISNAKVMFRNFAGKEGRYNQKGKRNFCVFLDSDDAEKLKNDGWNVKYLKPRDDDSEPQAYLQVSVNFGAFPPMIYVISSAGRVRMDEESVDSLDWLEFDNVDLIIRPYNWEVNGNRGVKAYLKKMYCTLAEDEFSEKYSKIPLMGMKARPGSGVNDDFDKAANSADFDDESLPF